MADRKVDYLLVGGGLASAQCAAAHVQPRAYEHRRVLVPRRRRHAGCARPLPPAVAVAGKAVRVAERDARGVAPAAQEQQAVGARGCGGVHAVEMWLCFVLFWGTKRREEERV